MRPATEELLFKWPVNSPGWNVSLSHAHTETCHQTPPDSIIIKGQEELKGELPAGFFISVQVIQSKVQEKLFDFFGL